MNHKTFHQKLLFCLVAIMLAVNVTGAVASPAVKLTQAGNVFTVYPTNGDDTENIKQAFDLALAAGPGSTVQLAPGYFRVRIGVIEVQDFNGTFKGAGQGVTVIDTFADQECQPLIDNNQLPVLVTFIRGYPRISDLTFHITPPAPCLPYSMEIHPEGWLDSHIFPLMVATSPYSTATDCVQKTEPVSAVVERVTIQGEEGPRWNGETDTISPNIYEGIWLGGGYPLEVVPGDCSPGKYAQGEFKVVQSTFRYALVGLAVEVLENSTVLIGGSPQDGNTFDNDIYGSLQGDASGSHIEFSHNRLDHIYANGVYLFQGGYEMQFIQTASDFAYLQNDLTLDGWANGFALHDYERFLEGREGRLHVIVENNRMNLLPNWVWGVWLEGVDGAVITNNKFVGNSAAAIYAGGNAPTRRALIKGNNVNGFTCIVDDWTCLPDDPNKIVLDWGTQNYVVVGGPTDNVLDWGTDNLVNGQGNPHHTNLGHVIQDAMKRKMEIIKSLPR